MSIQHMAWVWEHSPYAGATLLVHLALADFADDRGRCWPSQETLARRARCSDRMARKAIETMRADGFLSVVSQRFTGRSNLYELSTGSEHRSGQIGTPFRSVRQPVPTPRNPSSYETGTPVPTNHQEPSWKSSEEQSSYPPADITLNLENVRALREQVAAGFLPTDTHDDRFLVTVRGALYEREAQ